MEFDNAGASEQWKNGDRSDLSDFSGSESNQKLKKDKHILGSKKKDKEKKKEKETRYATLGDESSGEEESKKKNKKKGFQFGSAKKEKKEKKDREAKEHKELRKKEKKEKEKQKIKLKKVKGEGDVEGGKSKVEEVPVFGVPLSLAVERSRCHDGIKLPVVVRECIDFIEEHGLKVEGIYRSSGVKSKVNKLKLLYNTRQSVSLVGSEPAVVASLLKLFLRELPDPVLTQHLMVKFEEVSNAKEKEGGDVLKGLRALVGQLPECNRTLLEWIFVHMEHVIQHEKQNKMSLQNVSIVLSPTMQISHRVLYCLFKHSKVLFGHVQIKKYVPPISGQGGVNVLPESPEGIEEEMKKQESLLEDLHKEISLGVASKEIEEQLWEQQRIVTQLKRKLRLAKSQHKNEDHKPDLEEELNFSLQTPVVSCAPAFPPTATEEVQKKPEEESKASEKEVLSSPDEKGEETGREHRVTVQIHQADNLDTEKGHVTVIKLEEKEKATKDGEEKGLTDTTDGLEPSESDSKRKDVEGVVPSPMTGLPVSQPTGAELTGSSQVSRESTLTHTAVAEPSSGTNQAPREPVHTHSEQTATAYQASREPLPPSVRGDVNMSQRADLHKDNASRTAIYENVEPKSKKVDFKPDPTPEVVKKKEIRINISSENSSNQKEDSKATEANSTNKLGFPLLPPPPASSKLSSRGLLKPTILPRQEMKMKSKSLPRGLPSDIATFNNNNNSITAGRVEKQSSELDNRVSDERSAANGREALLWEEFRLKFEYEELLNLKSELERKKKTERREIAELQEEIATMQTLYQYRTYSVDSSEDSDVEEDKRQVNEDNRVMLRQLAKEQADLEQKKRFLVSKLENERKICLQLRVQIRLEQERLKRKGL